MNKKRFMKLAGILKEEKSQEYYNEQNISTQEEVVDKWLPYFSKVGFSKDDLEMVEPDAIKFLGQALKSYIKDISSKQSIKKQVDYVEGHKKGVEDFKKHNVMLYKTKSPSDPKLIDTNGNPVPNKLINFAKGYIQGYKTEEEKTETKL